MNLTNFLRFHERLQQNHVIAAWSVATGIIWVTLLWGSELESLGLNATVYLLAVLGLFLWAMRRQGVTLAANLYWIAPAVMLAASYSLYTNEFVKFVNFLVLPVALSVFYGLAHAPEGKSCRWSMGFMAEALFRFFSPVAKLRAALGVLGSVGDVAKGKGRTGKSVVIGLLLLFVFAATVVLPLLSSADAQFGQYADSFLKWFRELIGTTLVLKIGTAALLALVTVAALLAWGRPAGGTAARADERPLDSVVAGIVLGGILVMYALFIAVQARHVLVGQLPFEFAEAVYAVKSGFWQLIVLSALNVLIFMMTYRRTARLVQGILTAFTYASLFLLASAAQRMFLYVTNYGFSFEKFYATLAVIYCAALFTWLIVQVTRRRDADVGRFAVLLFIWMYAAASLFPLEQFVMRANVALAARPGSHVRLYELTMLSTDVWGLVRESRDNGTLEANERARNKNFDMTYKESFLEHGWDVWIDNGRTRLTEKHWYQMNLSDAFSLMDMARK